MIMIISNFEKGKNNIWIYSNDIDYSDNESNEQKDKLTKLLNLYHPPPPPHSLPHRSIRNEISKFSCSHFPVF